MEVGVYLLDIADSEMKRERNVKSCIFPYVLASQLH